MKISILLLLVPLSATAETSVFVVHFEPGIAWDQSIGPNEQTGFKAHSLNLRDLRRAGTIVFGARYEDQGMIFIRVDTLDAGKKLLDNDPGVQSRIFSYRIAPLSIFYPWKELE